MNKPLKLPENGFEVLASDGGGKITFERLTISPENMKALQQANEQLQAQNGAMRDALAKAGAALELSKIHIKSCFSTTHRTIDKALAAIDKIGGREDV